MAIIQFVFHLPLPQPTAPTPFYNAPGKVTCSFNGVFKWPLKPSQCVKIDISSTDQLFFVSLLSL